MLQEAPQNHKNKGQAGEESSSKKGAMLVLENLYQIMAESLKLNTPLGEEILLFRAFWGQTTLSISASLP